ncbi:hypothetical protein D3C87_80860 [compost metagenome]
MTSVFKYVASYYETLSDEQINDLEDIEFTAKMLDYEIVADTELDWVVFVKNKQEIFDAYFGNKTFSVIARENVSNLRYAQKKYEYTEERDSQYWFENLKWKELVELCKMFL